MDPATRVCPFCGEPPGPGVFCEACGRNLADVERLPTAGEMSSSDGPTVAEFLDAMRAAGNPGATDFPSGKPRAFRRAPHLTGWVVVPVDREDFDGPSATSPACC